MEDSIDKKENTFSEPKEEIKKILEKKRLRIEKSIKEENLRKISKLEDEIKNIKNDEKKQLNTLKEEIENEKKSLIEALDEEISLKKVFERIKGNKTNGNK